MAQHRLERAGVYIILYYILLWSFFFGVTSDQYVLVYRVNWCFITTLCEKQTLTDTRGPSTVFTSL